MRPIQLLTTTALALIICGSASAQTNSGQNGTDTNQRYSNEQTQGQGAIVTLAPSAVRLIQQKLNQIGYDAGNLTGNWDQQTSQAARLFQEANNLEPTGTATIPTLNCLGGSQGGTALLSGQYVGGGANVNQRFLNEQAQAGGVRISASPAQIREIQQHLNQLGYDSGNLSGKWDNQTSEAARRFQQANNLEPTGNLDVALISEMGGNRIIFGASCSGGNGSNNNGGSATHQRFLNEQTDAQGEPIYFSPASVRLVQQALNASGYNAGNLTGTWDQHTQDSARLFERANQLEPTGALTTSMLARLGMPNWYTGEVLHFNPMSARNSQGGNGGNLSVSSGRNNGGGGSGGGGGGGNFTNNAGMANWNNNNSSGNNSGANGGGGGGNSASNNGGGGGNSANNNNSGGGGFGNSGSAGGFGADSGGGGANTARSNNGGGGGNSASNNNGAGGFGNNANSGAGNKGGNTNSAANAPSNASGNNGEGRSTSNNNAGGGSNGQQTQGSKSQ